MTSFLTKWAAFADKHKDAFTHYSYYGNLYPGMYGIWEGEGAVFMQYIFRGAHYRLVEYNLELVDDHVRVYGPLHDPNPMDVETNDPETAHCAVLKHQRAYDLAKPPHRKISYRPVWVDNPSLGPRPDNYRIARRPRTV